jgi:hypothetical protein
MTWIDLEILGQNQQLLVDARVELCRVLTGTTRKIRPSDRADEQRVARQHEPRIGSALQVRDQQRNALR